MNFLLNESNWLQGKVEFTKYVSSTRRPGRPLDDFETTSVQTKRKRTADLRASTSTAELLYATQMKPKADGLKYAAKLVKKVSVAPDSAKELENESRKSSAIRYSSTSIIDVD